ncbi:hypothetical protein C0J52_21789 [Blattella germanica]|nr:hypothetical protein C0J52_21789 [Blattella germanica]
MNCRAIEEEEEEEELASSNLLNLFSGLCGMVLLFNSTFRLILWQASSGDSLSLIFIQEYLQSPNVSSYKSSDDEGADSLSTPSSSSRVGSTRVSSSESEITVCSSLTTSLAITVTFAPSFAASIATDLPMPLDPPVICKDNTNKNKCRSTRLSPLLGLMAISVAKDCNPAKLCPYQDVEASLLLQDEDAKFGHCVAPYKGNDPAAQTTPRSIRLSPQTLLLFIAQISRHIQDSVLEWTPLNRATALLSQFPNNENDIGRRERSVCTKERSLECIIYRSLETQDRRYLKNNDSQKSTIWGLGKYVCEPSYMKVSQSIKVGIHSLLDVVLLGQLHHTAQIMEKCMIVNGEYFDKLLVG